MGTFRVMGFGQEKARQVVVARDRRACAKRVGGTGLRFSWLSQRERKRRRTLNHENRNPVPPTRPALNPSHTHTGRVSSALVRSCSQGTKNWRSRLFGRKRGGSRCFVALATVLPRHAPLFLPKQRVAAPIVCVRCWGRDDGASERRTCVGERAGRVPIRSQEAAPRVIGTPPGQPTKPRFNPGFARNANGRRRFGGVESGRQAWQ